MSVEITEATAYTTRFTVNSLSEQLAAELSSDANASGASVPAKKKDVVRRCAARMWDGYDWRFRRRRFTLTAWPTQTGTCTGAAFDGTSTALTANTGTFYETMVNHSIVITGVGTFTISAYTSSTVVTVTGNASDASASVWSVTADGTYYVPSWVAKLDQRWLVERNHDGSSGCRITEDVQVFQRMANMTDQDASENTREPVCIVIVRDPDLTTFEWYAMATPPPDEVYQYDIWAITRNPYDTNSLSDTSVLPWPESFDQAWEHYARWMMNLSFGNRDDVEKLKKVYEDALDQQKKDNDETLTTPNESIDQDPNGDYGCLMSQQADPSLRTIR
jgi:hypothetical protein